jgi:hypothetical protein
MLPEERELVSRESRVSMALKALTMPLYRVRSKQNTDTLPVLWRGRTELYMPKDNLSTLIHWQKFINANWN